MVVKDYVTIGIFLAAQTGGAIWFASSMNTTQTEIKRQVTEIKEQVSENKLTNDQEELRQWQRLNRAEDQLTQVLANERTTMAVFQSIQEDITLLRKDIEDNNALLREIILEERKNGTRN